ncbi:MAG: RbsD/FucU family protein [Alphaproteobacteria bacterium]
MLKGLDPLLNADLLHTLRAMGHGDDIAIVDGNFPAATMGRRLIRMDGHSATRVLDAVLSVMPLDTFVETAAWRMEVVDDPSAVPPICTEFQDCIDRAEGKGRFSLGSLERFAFYEQTRACFAVVATGESRLYGNIILRMGVIPPKE